MRIYVDEDLKVLDKYCDWHDETTITYPGIDGEIKILFGVSPDEARRFLKYLSGMSGEIVRGESVSPDIFKGVTEIYGTKTEDGQRIKARYKNSCGVRTVSAVAFGRKRPAKLSYFLRYASPLLKKADRRSKSSETLIPIRGFAANSDH